MSAAWPPIVPEKWGDKIEVEVVDETHIKIKDKATGHVLMTLDKEQFEAQVQPALESYNGR